MQCLDFLGPLLLDFAHTGLKATFSTHLIFLQINYTFSRNKVIMGATALIAGVLTVFLPETLGMPFPEKVPILLEIHIPYFPKNKCKLIGGRHLRAV